MKKLLLTLLAPVLVVLGFAGQAFATYHGEPIPDSRMHVVVTTGCANTPQCIRWIRADGTPRQGPPAVWVNEAPLSSYCGQAPWSSTSGWHTWGYGHSSLSGVLPDGNNNSGCTFLSWTITEFSP